MRRLFPRVVLAVVCAASFSAGALTAPDGGSSELLNPRPAEARPWLRSPEFTPELFAAPPFAPTTAEPLATELTPPPRAEAGPAAAKPRAVQVPAKPRRVQAAAANRSARAARAGRPLAIVPPLARARPLPATGAAQGYAPETPGLAFPFPLAFQQAQRTSPFDVPGGLW